MMSYKDKTISEQTVLESLDKAISSYTVKDFEKILSTVPVMEETFENKDLSVTKRKKAVKTKKLDLQVEDVIVTKKTRKTKGKKSLKNIKYFKKSFLSTLSIPHGEGVAKLKKQMFTVALSMVMVSFVAMSTYVAYAYVANQGSDLVANVSKHVVLPVNETPKVYIIQSDKSEVFQNPMFKGIEVGDNVLTYTASKKVVIYRSSEDKIVSIVNLDN